MYFQSRKKYLCWKHLIFARGNFRRVCAEFEQTIPQSRIRSTAPFAQGSQKSPPCVKEGGAACRDGRIVFSELSHEKRAMIIAPTAEDGKLHKLKIFVVFPFLRIFIYILQMVHIIFIIPYYVVVKSFLPYGKTDFFWNLPFILLDDARNCRGDY